MYERFYGFRERPFSLLPDPDFLFLGEKHRTALDLLELAIFNKSGFCVISGEIGAGKTTLIRELLNRLDDRVRVGLVSNTHPSFGELLQWIMAAYGLKCGSDDQLELHKRFIDFTVQQYAENRHTLLIVDEAQNLSAAALEELRMLSNVNSDKDMVLQVILIGQQQLRDKLKLPELEQFAQRIALDYHLVGLNPQETRQYIDHRVKHAGGTPGLFEQAACQAVYGITRGIPRVINRVCDLSLVYGYSEESPRISAEIVNKVIEDQHMGNLLDVLPVAADMPQAENADPGTATAGDHPAVDINTLTDTADMPEPAGKDNPTLQDTELAGQTPAGQKTDAGKVPGDEASAADCTVSAADTVDAEGEPESQPEKGGAPDPRSGEADDSVPTSLLHELVVNAEQKSRTKGDRGALLLLAVVVAMVGATGWMTRDIWTPALLGEVPAISQQEVPRFLPEKALSSMMEAEMNTGQASTSGSGNDRHTNAVVPLTQVEQPAKEPGQPARRRISVTEVQPEPIVHDESVNQAGISLPPAEVVLETGKNSQPQDGNEEIAVPVTTAVTEPDVQDAALQQEAERLARLKMESERLEQERRATEERLARQRAARLELERKARLEQEKLESEARRLEQERLATEQRLARQRAAREELERRTRLEREKIDEARRSVEQVAVDREQVESRLSGERRAAPAPLAVTGSGEAAPVAQSLVTGSEDKPADKQEKKSGASSSPAFSGNPCKGPTAKFMSTCR